LNVTCDKCQKRYSVPDEKVRGKAVRLRCKNCQNLITIQPVGSSSGTGSISSSGSTARPATDRTATKELNSQAAAMLAAKTSTPHIDRSAVWYAMIKGKQEGPFDFVALDGKIKGGEITQRTYLWKQGMADWKRAADLTDLASLFAPAPAAPVAAAKAAPAPFSALPFDDGEDEKQTTVAPSPLESNGKAAKDNSGWGELFSDEGLDKAETTEPGPGVAEPSSKKKKKDTEEDDPFAKLGDIDPAQLPPAGEATQFFIAQAGVNKRNPPWKIATFIILLIGVPAGLLYALSALKIVPLQVTRLDESGNEVTESVFSSGGVSGLADLLSGKTRAKQEARKTGAVAAKAPRRPDEPATGVAIAPKDPKTPTGSQGMNAKALADLYGEKVDKGPVVRKDVETRATSSSTGGISEESVQKVVAQTQSAFEKCIEAELRKNPNFRGGKINIIAMVGSSGVVTKAEIDRKDIDTSELGACLKGRAKRMTFAAFSGDEEAEVYIPLILGTSME
jgi:predicted Zn finger-like uncharacterized protein